MLCEHGNPVRVGEPFTTDQCRICWWRRKAAGPRPCRFRGAATGQTQGCSTCTKRIEVPLVECARHDRCTLDKVVPGAACCLICDDREEPAAATGPALTVVPGLVDPLPGEAVSPPTVEHRRSAASAAAHLDALRKVLAFDPAPAPAPRRGILYVGGGKYWPGIVAGIRLLREVGCTLPVEVWHRGECEAVNAADVDGLGVAVVDADAMSAAAGDNRVPRGNAGVGGWESKLYALTHTSLEQVLFLDADAYCVADPAPLFDLLSPAEPFAFWSDLPSCEGNVKWERVWPAGKAGVPTVQGGQLLIDRRHAGKLLAAAHWMCQHSDYYFAWMFGDQDTWRVALAAGAGGWRHLGAAPWKSVAFVCGWRGVDYIVHRCQSKLFRPGDIPPGKVKYSNPNYALPKEGRIFTHFAAALAGESAADAFREIYARKLWHDGTSGAGSDPAEAAPYVEAVQRLAAERGWRSCVDAGCGDGRVGAALGFVGPDYTGADVCPHLIDRHRRAYPARNWIVADIAADLDRLPAADVLLVKDVLHHWPTAVIRRFLDAATTSGKWRACLFTQDTGQRDDHTDCHMGGYRALDPDREPLRAYGLRVAFRYAHKAGLLWESGT